MIKTIKTIGIISLLVLNMGCVWRRTPALSPPRAIELFDYAPRYDILFSRNESLLLIFDDDTCVSFSSYEQKLIGFTIDIMQAIIKGLGKEWSNVKIAIHNHFELETFSDTDLWFEHCIRLRGFKGRFQLYLVSKQEVIIK